MIKMQDEWIKVEDRLPSDSGWYIVLEYAPSDYSINIRQFVKNNNQEHFITGYPRVIAWNPKPIPSPY